MRDTREPRLRSTRTRRIPAALAIACLVILAGIAGAPGNADAGSESADATPAGQPVFADLLPQDLNSYRVGGWQEPLGGDGTGGTVRPTFDGSAAYFDGTTKALAYAVRNDPDIRDFEMTVGFTITNEQPTPDDHLVLLLRFQDPILPAACCFGGAGEVHARSGLAVDFNVGRGTVTPYRERNGARVSALETQIPFHLSFDAPHTMRVSFAGVDLGIDVDGVPVARWHVQNFAPGRIGFEAYRLDMMVTNVTLVTQ